MCAKPLCYYVWPVILCALSSASSAQLAVQLQPSDITEKFARTVGEHTLEAMLTARRGERPKELVKAQCGHVHDLYWTALAAANPGTSVVPEAELEEGVSIKLPSCIPPTSFQVKPVPATSFKRLTELYATDPAGFGTLYEPKHSPAAWKQPHKLPKWELEATPAGSLRYPSVPTDLFASYSSAVLALNPETIVPTTSPDQFFVPAPGTSYVFVPAASSTWMRVNFESNNSPEFVANALGLQPPQIDLGGFEHFSDVPVQCPQTTEVPAVDEAERVKSLLYTLVRNRATLKKANRSVRPSFVLVPDTGVFPSDGYLLSSARHDNAGALPYVRAESAPHAGMGELAGHGTKVAALALGGVNLLELLNASDYLPVLDSVNIFTRDTPGILRDENGTPILAGPIPQPAQKYSLQSEALFNAIQQTSALVVNMSLGRAKKMSALEMRLNDRDMTIFVVAAGNSKKDLSKEDVYPAKYGGKGNLGQYNLITVAALNKAGEIAPFANFGPSHVDVAVVGCDVETFAFRNRYERVRVTGSSFAAPQVAATVALIRATTAEYPHLLSSMVRARVLVGADHRPELAGSVKNGRVLNMNRSLLSIFFDVAELARPKKKQIHGTVANRGFDTFCKTKPQLPASARLLGVRPHPESANKLVFDWTDGQQQHLDHGECERAPDAKLTITDALDGSQTLVPVADLAGIVFAMLPR